MSTAEALRWDGKQCRSRVPQAFDGVAGGRVLIHG